MGSESFGGGDSSSFLVGVVLFLTVADPDVRVSKSKLNFGFWILSSGFGHFVEHTRCLPRVVDLMQDGTKWKIGVSRLLELLLVFSFA